MTEILGGDCSTKESIVSGLTLKRSFTAKNLGEIPVHVYDFLINGYSCEAYGFKVCISVFIFFNYKCILKNYSLLKLVSFLFFLGLGLRTLHTITEQFKDR